MKYEILAEKPSAAKHFAKALGGMTGTFEGNPYVIAMSHGHLLELNEPAKQVSKENIERYSDWSSYRGFPWNPSDFNWGKHYIDRNAKQTAEEIGKRAKGCDAIIIATDPDPSGEGDLLAWEIIQANHWKGKVYRANFKSEQPAEFIESLRKKIDVSDPTKSGVYLEAVARQRFDFCSMQLSRIATLATREAGFNVTVIRLGRFKSALVMLVYEQQQKLKHYVKKPYYEVVYKDGHDNVFRRSWSEGADFRFDNKGKADADLNNYMMDRVVQESLVEKRTQPPVLINLIGLATLLAKKGFSTKQVKDTYQKMYEEQYVSYPRTADTKIDQSDFNQLLGEADAIADVVGVDKSLLTHRTARRKFLTDHEDPTERTGLVARFPSLLMSYAPNLATVAWKFISNLPSPILQFCVKTTFTIKPKPIWKNTLSLRPPFQFLSK